MITGVCMLKLLLNVYVISVSWGSRPLCVLTCKISLYFSNLLRFTSLWLPVPTDVPHSARFHSFWRYPAHAKPLWFQYFKERPEI